MLADPLTEGDQAVAGVMAGYQVYYQRGISTYVEIIAGWSYLAFIVNANTNSDGRAYPYFRESPPERTTRKLAAAVGGGHDQ